MANQITNIVLSDWYNNGVDDDSETTLFKTKSQNNNKFRKAEWHKDVYLYEYDWNKHQVKESSSVWIVMNV